jgi:type VI secretion system protein ImpA
VISLATAALATSTKDLQIAVWLLEALVRWHGFAGLRDGIRLLRELQERFWPSLHPAIEDGNAEFRTGPLEWVNEKLPIPVRQIVVTGSKDGPNYSWLQWKESRDVDNLGRQSREAMAAALAEGKISGEQFDKAVAASSRAYYERLFDDLNLTWEECGRLVAVVDEKFGPDAPSLLGLKKAIEDCRALTEAIVKKKRELEPDAVTTMAADTQGAAQAQAATRGAGAAVMLGQPTDRGTALRQLAAVAAFFRRTEPHSPVAYLVERAIRWGEMPLDEWLRDVINNSEALGRIRETLGIKDSGGG